MSSADALLATGAPPSFRRIDQLIVFSCHRLPRRKAFRPVAVHREQPVACANGGSG
jgi:hypothetical protein